MLLNYLILLLLLFVITEHHRVVTTDHDKVISISSVLGAQLILNTEVLNELENIVWYKGINDLKLLISNSVSLDFTVQNQSRYHIVNQTKLLIEQTLIGDEGYYTLKIKNQSKNLKQYLYHVRFLFF
jgi:hypothetical protein